ncbi:ABC transporter ATP-binding protein [Faecalicatena contorta]|uniref:ABC transporter ATP-binding protein n=1 Tax=Faecalicatena contorta TaxID=39482 RepID=UPI001F44B9C1|nr:ABC transporter ATP-binding protein [Faecalicatena contorta]MCF2684059.1 ABC transporter ATP-binding protein [Faecalicatena contorta]
MRKLLKFLKPYAGGVVAVICVLVVQAFCDLSLPTYTSDIVNIGIQQGGIDETVPETIAKADLEKLLLFVPSKEQEIVMKAYTETTKTYGYDGIIMELKSSVQKNKEKMEQLSSVLGKPMFLVTGFDSDSDMTKQMQGQMQEQMKMPDISKMSIYDMFGMMSDEQRDQVIEQMDEKISDMPDSMIEQAAASYIRNAYECIGMDVDEIEIRYVLHTGGKMLALAALGMVASILVGLMASRIGAGVGRGLRRDVFRKVVGFSNGEFDKFSTASLITRSTNDIQQIQMLVVMILRMVMYAPIMAIGGIWKVFHTNVDMSWIIALAVGMIVAIVAVLFVMVMPKFQIMQKLVDRLNLVSREILTGLQVIRAFGTQKHEEERFDVANRDLVKANLFVNRAMTLMMPMMMFIMNGIGVLIVWVGGHSINDGAMQVGDMMAFIQYTMQIIMSFLMICMISVMLPRAAVSAERVDEVLKSDTMIHDPKQPKRLAEEGKGEVVFDHVSFRYPGADEDVLHDISFTAKPGETTAFIGSTGCGKSTLVNLIPRFYDVTEGKITIDGKDIREVSQHELREKLGYVPQKGILFSGDIASNIMYGNPKGSEAEMVEAASIAQAAEFIEQKKKQYHSAISQGGSNVSGGQKQRLSIARAIAKHPDVYIFDDSFSALDYRTDATLRAALKEKTADSTVMIVAQRISTILHAEQIIVLEDGQIVGKGTHKQLLKNCDAYYQIASSQMSEQELENDMKEVV